MTRGQQGEKALKWKAILDDIGLPFYLNQSNCLSLYRDGQFFESNRSVDIAILGEDLTNEKLGLLKQHEFDTENGHKAPLGLMYFDSQMVEIQPVYFVNGKGYYNLIDDTCLVWDEKHFKKENWIKYSYLGVEWNLPGFTDEYLAGVYGEWQTPQPFVWNADAKNITTYQKLYEPSV